MDNVKGSNERAVDPVLDGKVSGRDMNKVRFDLPLSRTQISLENHTGR